MTRIRKILLLMILVITSTMALTGCAAFTQSHNDAVHEDAMREGAEIFGY